MERAYKGRIYPNAEQRAMIENTFGACRWVWNLSLATKEAAWKVNKKNISYVEMCRQLTIWKRTVAKWLYDVSNHALQNSIRDLYEAYKNFFRRVKNGEKPGYPKPKSRYNSRQSFRLNCDNNQIRMVDSNHVRLPRLGIMKFSCGRLPEGRILNGTVRRTPSGRYELSLCCTDVPEPECQPGSVDVMGIDLGVKDLMTRSDGTKVPNNRYAYRLQRKHKREQRRLSRRKKGSNRYRKQKVTLARVDERIANLRNTDIHKATTDAVRTANAIAIEDLNVSGMMKNHHLARSVADASMSEISRQLTYKCQWYGRDLVKVDRWFPSTQICGNCGELTGPKGKEGLRVRQWTCPSCGAVHDRDLNAAKNIAKRGAEMLDVTPGEPGVGD